MTGQAPAQAPSPLPPIQGGDLASLQAQAADLRAQLAGLQAQWNGLMGQLDQMLRSNPARPGVQQQWADVGVQVAKAQGDLAMLQARIAQKQGLPVGTPTVPPIPRGFNFPDPTIPAVSGVALILLFPISVAWAKRVLRRAPNPAPVPSDVTMRLDRIEHAVDTIAIEIERISEGQRFVTKVMAGRPATRDSSVGSSADASVPQEKQPLALGAGPMEPIAVAERERVRERATPPH
jgi:hypothetical protein